MNSSDPFEQRLDDFDVAWNSKGVPSINDYLPSASDADRREMLIELVMIDLEYRWRPAQGSTIQQDAQEGTLPWFPLIRDYQRVYPLLGSCDALPLSLIAEEYRVRSRWGDRPTRNQYRIIYGDRDGGINSCLDKVDAELQLTGSANPELGRQDSAEKTPSLLSGKTGREQLEVGDLVDDFRLLNKLGSGAFADVFLAQQRSMHRLVALKVSETFSSEPKALSVLNHPNIVRVYDERQVQGLSLLYMQYVSGGNLREILDDMKASIPDDYSGQMFLDSIQHVLEAKGEIPSISRVVSPVQAMDWPTTVAWIGVGLASALQHAHEQDVHHRDIKFENILVTAGGRPMLVDFNLGFGESLADDHGELFGGSLAYMSAEQLEVLLHRSDPKDVGPESDFYSLSIVLWELLTGSRPFDGDADRGESTLQQMLELRQQGADPSALPTKCPGGLRKTLLDCLAPSKFDNLLEGPTYFRRLQLSLLPEVDELLSPPPDSQQAKWAKHPTLWLLLFGIVPNVIVSLINIWANDRLTTHHFDRQFFWTQQLPVVNTVNYSLGTLLMLGILWPLLRGLWSEDAVSLRKEQKASLGYRCLAAPGWIAVVILMLWIVSGVVFPMWNRVAPESSVGLIDSLVFLSSQILHGIIAAATTFVFISLVLVTGLFPLLIGEREDQQGIVRLAQFRSLLNRSMTCLGISPLLAILLLALTDRGDDQAEQSVFVMLALVGFAGHWIASRIIPFISAKVDALMLALAPTNELPGRTAVDAFHGTVNKVSR